jgi:plasmid replication initiation protein
MSLTVKQVTNLNGFPKAAELIEITGAHALEASDRAVFNQLYKIAHDSNRLVMPEAEWEVTLAGLRRASSKHESNDRVKESLRRLRNTPVKVTYIDETTGKRRVLETHLLEFTDTEDDPEASDSTVQFGIPNRLRAVLVRSNRWGRIRCEVSYAMTSKYAIALYELVSLRANRDHCVEVLSYEEFRELLNVPPNSYERGLDFQRKVVAPALLEVNGLSDLGVQIEFRRRHARAPIHEVAISWWKKSADEYRAAAQERNRSKVGRMARLKGQVETAKAPEPAMLVLPWQEKVNKTVEAMREAGAPEEDVQSFIESQRVEHAQPS